MTIKITKKEVELAIVQYLGEKDLNIVWENVDPGNFSPIISKEGHFDGYEIDTGEYQA